MQAVDLGSPQQQAVLLALLCRQGRAVSVSELVDDVWGESPPRAAVGTIRTYVSRLRRQLDPDHVIRRRSTLLPAVAGGYALQGLKDPCDLSRLRSLTAAADDARRAGAAGEALDHLRRASALWRGTTLAGVPGPFADVQRARLEERRMSTTEACSELELELGEHTAAIVELTAICNENPLRERPRELLMRALHESGRRGEALAVFADVRRALNDELGVEPGDRLRALHLTVLRDAPADTRPTQRPAQLPPDINDFTGRTEWVAELRSKLLEPKGRGTPVVAVTGIAGSGKTTLAVHIAHTVLDEFPDGQLFVDLGGADPGAVLGVFLRALGVAADTVPDALGERAALLRSTLANRRVLLVLDNANDPALLRWLLPGSSGCAVLITSRRRGVGVPVATAADLTAFSPDEAMSLLGHVAGADRVAAEPDAAQRVVAACGHLPLAVRTVACRLGTRPEWTMAGLAGSLADERRRIAQMRDGDLAVAASFEVSYQQLSDSDQRAFRLLARPALAELSVPVAAAILGDAERSAEGAMETLVDMALLESPAPHRYRYHDLLRIFARDHSAAADPAADRIASMDRLVEHYLATARNAYLLTAPDPLDLGHLSTIALSGHPLGDAHAATDWILAEQANIAAVVHQISGSRQGHPALLAELVLMATRLADH